MWVSLMDKTKYRCPTCIETEMRLLATQPEIVKVLGRITCIGCRLDIADYLEIPGIHLKKYVV